MQCTYCRKVGENAPCKRCGDVQYCSKRCRRSDWDDHSKVCIDVEVILRTRFGPGRSDLKMYGWACTACGERSFTHCPCGNAVYCKKECIDLKYHEHRFTCLRAALEEAAARNQPIDCILYLLANKELTLDQVHPEHMLRLIFMNKPHLIEIVRKRIVKPVDWNAMLLFACKSHHALVKPILGMGVDANSKGEDGRSSLALLCADVTLGRSQFIQVGDGMRIADPHVWKDAFHALVEHGADINCAFGQTNLISYAFSAGCVDLIAAFTRYIGHGLDIHLNIKGDNFIRLHHDRDQAMEFRREWSEYCNSVSKALSNWTLSGLRELVASYVCIPIDTVEEIVADPTNLASLNSMLFQYRQYISDIKQIDNRLILKFGASPLQASEIAKFDA